MRVVNETFQELPDGRPGPPWPHAVGVIPAPSGAPLLVVAIKLVWRLSVFVAAPPEAQAPIQVEDRFDARGVLVRPSELMALGTATNIIVEGEARGDAPFEQRDVFVRVGDVSHAATVFGPRVWQRHGEAWAPSRPRSVHAVPLAPSLAFGGRGHHPNPVGIGLVGGDEDPTGAPLPQIEVPERRVTSPRDRPPPALFGAVSPHWSPRRERAGTFDAAWRRTRAPLMASDTDWRFFDCATSSLTHAPFVRGGEPLLLRGFSERDTIARLPRFEFRLVLARRAKVMRPSLLRVLPNEDLVVLSYVAAVSMDLVLSAGKTVSISERWVLPRREAGVSAP